MAASNAAVRHRAIIYYKQTENLHRQQIIRQMNFRPQRTRSARIGIWQHQQQQQQAAERSLPYIDVRPTLTAVKVARQPT